MDKSVVTRRNVLAAAGAAGLAALGTQAVAADAGAGGNSPLEGEKMKERQERPTKQWRWIVRLTPSDVINWVNTQPSQGAGEFEVANRADGKIDVYYYM